MNREIKELIVQRLRELPVCNVNDDKTEYTVRCPYCGDSTKDPTHAHLGLHIDLNQDDLMIYNCFRCGESGVITDSTLEDLGIYLSEQDIREFRSYTKKIAKITNRAIIRTERFQVPLCTPTQLTEAKRNYLCRRLHLDFSYEDMAKCKIIPSILQFMQANELKFIPNVPDKVLWALENFYIGFLSSNNNLLTFRNIGQKGKRYYKAILNPNNADNNTFYSIPSQLDLMYTGDLHIHIAEGTFDILSIKYNVNPQYERQAFYASCGYSYMAILKNLARNGIVSNLIVHIYADRDKTDRDHWKLLHSSPVYAFIEHAYLHRNGVQDEKDYGVPLSQIQDTARKLW